MKQVSVVTPSASYTQHLAAQLARALAGGEIIFLRGPIGAGKTVFVKGVAQALGLKGSPTSASFSLVKEYKNKNIRLFHMDLFRLEEGELFNLGFEEMLEDEQAVMLVEWPDPAARLFPQDRLELDFILEHDDRRTLHITAHGRTSGRLLEALCKNR